MLIDIVYFVESSMFNCLHGVADDIINDEVLVSAALSSTLVELSEFRSQVGVSGDSRLVSMEYYSEWIPQ